MAITVEDIAKASHAVIAAMASEFDNNQMPAWDDAEQWMRDSSIETVQAILNDPYLPNSHFHNVWMAQRIAAGWKWGPVRNNDTKENPAMVPYDELPPHQRAKDGVLKALVDSLKHHLQ